MLTATKPKNSFFNFIKKQNFSVDEECYEESFLDQISRDIEGFSGREISKLLIAVKYNMLMDPKGSLTKQAMETVINDKVTEHHDKFNFVKSNIQNLVASTPSRDRQQDFSKNDKKLNELQLKLARRRSINGESTPGVVVLSAQNQI